MYAIRSYYELTTYDIARACLKGDLKLYQGTVSETDPEYTSDEPGYWLLADGTVGEYASSLVWCSIGYSETDLYLYGGNHPANAVSGDSA